MNSDPSEQTRLRNSPLPFAKSETPQPTRAGRLPRWSISKRSEGFSDVLNAMHDVCPTAKATEEERGRSEWPTSSQPCPSVNGETSSSSSDTKSNAGALGTAYYETPQTPGHQLSDELAKYQEQTNPAQLLPQAMTVERQKPLTPLRHRKLVKSIVALSIRRLGRDNILAVAALQRPLSLSCSDHSETRVRSGGAASRLAVEFS